MNLKDKNILWLTDYTIKEVPAGGAEITDSYVIKAGELLGYNIRVITPSRISTTDMSWCDLVVFSNNFSFPDSVRKRLMQEKPYIVYCHDSGRWLSIAKKQKDFFKRAKISVFLSPLHQAQFNEYLIGAKNIICTPPYIPYYFYDRGKQRNGRILYAGNMHEGKGLWDIVEFAKNNPSFTLDFHYHRGGNRITRTLDGLKNCNLLGYIENENIWKKYNEYSYFMHIPKCSEAFGRAVAEAYLSGCKIIGNNRLGVFSYNWDYKDLRINTLHADKLFWINIEKICKKTHLF